MKNLQRFCIAIGSISLLFLLISLSMASFPFSIACSLLMLLCAGTVAVMQVEPWESTFRSQRRWLKSHQDNLDLQFCLYIAVTPKGVYQSCVDLQELTGVYERCAMELQGYFGTKNVQRMTHDAFVVLRTFPSPNLKEEKEKTEYQTIVCQTIVQRLQALGGGGMPPYEVTVGCAASGIRYRMETLEQLVDLAYNTEQEARKRHRAWLVADAVIRARKLDIDECKQGFLSLGWENEFNPFFQPIIDPETFQVIGVESLARWQLGGFRVLAAQVFKEMAAELNHITTIDLIIITKTFSIVRTLMVARILPYTFKLVLNVSTESLKKGFAERMHFLVEQHGLHPSQVEFDVKDSALALPQSLLVIRQMREIGFKVSLDVFTETAFDLQAFARADFDTIKLDFTAYSPQLKEIFASLREAAREKGVEVLAKDIESKELLNDAISLGCTYLQGNYFTQPIPESLFKVFMQKYQQGLYLDSSLG